MNKKNNANFNIELFYEKSCKLLIRTFKELGNYSQLLKSKKNINNIIKDVIKSKTSFYDNGNESFYFNESMWPLDIKCKNINNSHAYNIFLRCLFISFVLIDDELFNKKYVEEDLYTFYYTCLDNTLIKENSEAKRYMIIAIKKLLKLNIKSVNLSCKFEKFLKEIEND